MRTGHRLVDHGPDGTAVFDAPRGPREVRADALVAADGIHAAIRRARHPGEGPPSWPGVAMWRGARWWPRVGDGRTMIVAGGMKAKLVLHPIATDPDRPGGALTNWVVCAEVGVSSDPLPHRDDRQGTGALADVMTHVDGRLDVPEVDLPALIRATDGIWVYPMCDRDPLPAWSEGRVTLLGDAAHATYPVGSNGASQAVLDAVSLARHLDERGPEAGLAAYDAERRPATAAIVAANREGGLERVIDLVEARAPGASSGCTTWPPPPSCAPLGGGYQAMAGFDGARA